jgi:CDP-diacylglycerol---glycerol-3-phosphate 3-phosphatidyltransferase
MVLPNQLTVLRIILTPVFFFMFLSEDPLMKQISLGVFIVAALTDWYDGWLARKYNYITSWGKFWDPLADKILTSAAFFAFVFVNVIPLWMVILIVLRDFIITGIRAYADYKGILFRTSRLAQWKTFLQMTFLYYLLLVYAGMITPGIYSGNESLFEILFHETFIHVTMLIITIITLYSGISYFYKNRLLIQNLFSDET